VETPTGPFQWVPTQRHGDLSLEDLGRTESAKKGERVLPRHRIECLAGRRSARLSRSLCTMTRPAGSVMAA
jgi:hypothetical protein